MFRGAPYRGWLLGDLIDKWIAGEVNIDPEALIQDKGVLSLLQEFPHEEDVLPAIRKMPSHRSDNR